MKRKPKRQRNAKSGPWHEYIFHYEVCQGLVHKSYPKKYLRWCATRVSKISYMAAMNDGFDTADKLIPCLRRVISKIF